MLNRRRLLTRMCERWPRVANCGEVYLVRKRERRVRYSEDDESDAER